MGDVVALVEKAAEAIEVEEAERLAKRMAKGQFDMNDFLAQIRQLQKMGGFGGLMGMLPGIGKMQKQIAAAGIDDGMIKRQEAIILSMTKKERISVGLLNASRRKRIAAGSGTCSRGEPACETISRYGSDDEKAGWQNRCCSNEGYVWWCWNGRCWNG